MPIIPEKKRTVTMILSKLKPQGGVESAPVHSEQDMGEHSPLKIIAEDMMLAFKNGSIAGLQDALEALVEHVGLEDEEDDKSEESEE
jgi:hypothetical protein